MINAKDMRWIFVLVLIGLVYWLFVNGYVNIDSSMQFIKSAVMEVINTITGFFSSTSAA